MGEYIAPLDFGKIIMNYFIGNQILFIYAFIITFSYVAAYFQMSNRLYFILLAIGSVMFASFIGQGVYFFIIMLIGFVVFKIMGSYFNR